MAYQGSGWGDNRISFGASYRPFGSLVLSMLAGSHRNCKRSDWHPLEPEPYATSLPLREPLEFEVDSGSIELKTYIFYRMSSNVASPSEGIELVVDSRSLRIKAYIFYQIGQWKTGNLWARILHPAYRQATALLAVQASQNHSRMKEQSDSKVHFAESGGALLSCGFPV